MTPTVDQKIDKLTQVAVTRNRVANEIERMAGYFSGLSNDLNEQSRRLRQQIVLAQQTNVRDNKFVTVAAFEALVTVMSSSQDCGADEIGRLAALAERHTVMLDDGDESDDD